MHVCKNKLNLCLSMHNFARELLNGYTQTSHKIYFVESPNNERNETITTIMMDEKTLHLTAPPP